MIFREDRSTTKTENVFVKKTCDSCGLVSTQYGHEWSKDTYEVLEVEVKFRKGSRYPEGDFTKTYCPDICPVCFEEKLIPFLKSIGVNCEFKDLDW
jgi:hypothetical protein